MKKVFALSLALCLLFSLSACGNSPAQSTAPVESKVEKVYSGEELFVSSPQEAVYPLTTGGETLTMAVSTITNPDGEFVEYSNKALTRSMEITGVNIQVVQTSSMGGGMEAMLDAASGEYPDLIWQPSSYLLEDEGEDVLILNDYLAQYAPNYLAALSGDEDARRSVLSDSGCALQFYTLNESKSLSVSYGPVIRKDLLISLGMDIPETYDELYNALSAMKNIFSLSLPIRLWPSGLTSADWLCSGYGVSLGSSSPNSGFYVVDGVVKYGPMEQGLVDYVTMMNKWYTEGLFTDAILDVLDIDSNSYLMQQSLGNSGLFFVNRHSIEICEQLSELEGFNLEPIPDPVVNKSDMTHLAENRMELAYSPAYAISADCEYPELAVQWLDFWYGEEGRLLMNYGIEGESYTLDEGGKPSYINPTADAGTMSSFTLWSMAGVLLDSRKAVNIRPGETAATDVWTRNKDSEYMLPNNLMMDVSMSEDLSMMLRDLNSAADEGIMKLITGETPMGDLENFRAQLNQMGAQRCIEYYQVFYDNYINR